MPWVRYSTGFETYSAPQQPRPPLQPPTTKQPLSAIFTLLSTLLSPSQNILDFKAPSLKQDLVLIDMLPSIATITFSCGHWHLSLVAITVNHNLNISETALSSWIVAATGADFLTTELVCEILSTMGNRNKMVDWTAVYWNNKIDSSINHVCEDSSLEPGSMWWPCLVSAGSVLRHCSIWRPG